MFSQIGLIGWDFLPPIFYFYFDTEGRQASAKAHEAVDHQASMLSCREDISYPQNWTANFFLSRGVTPCQFEHQVQSKFATPILHVIDHFKN